MELNWWDEHITGHASYGDEVTYPSREWLAGTVSGGKSLLEIGYGAGQEYDSLFNRFGRVIRYRGYDISEKFQKVCRAKFPAGDFRLGSIYQIPEPDCSWDIVLCRHVLEYQKEWKKAIDELWRVTKEKLIIILWRPLVDGEEICIPHPHGGYTMNFNRKEFWQKLESLRIPLGYYEFKTEIPNWTFVVEK